MPSKFNVGDAVWYTTIPSKGRIIEGPIQDALGHDLAYKVDVFDGLPPYLCPEHSLRPRKDPTKSKLKGSGDPKIESKPLKNSSV